jgi:hypothetical protein
LGFWSAVEQKSFKKQTILSFCLGLLRLIWLAAALDLVLSQNQNIQPYGYFHRIFVSIKFPISNFRVEKPEKLIEINLFKYLFSQRFLFLIKSRNINTMEKIYLFSDIISKLIIYLSTAQCAS